MKDAHGESRVEEGQLYVVATPIGNLEDISSRALKTLAAVNVIAAEDTRVSAHLLARHGIEKRLVALHEHNEARMTPQVLDWLRGGASVALVTDAGTPAVSDPGARLVARAHEQGIRVIPIPGPSAPVAALSAAGIESPHFLFYGFLPSGGASRRKALAELATLPWTLVFFEAPHRIVECVGDLAQCLPGERTIVLARELTKIFETVHRCPLSDAPGWLESDPDRRRGEFVLVVSGSDRREDPGVADLDRALQPLLAELPLAQAVKLACAITGMRRKEIYSRALELSGRKGGKA